MIPTIPSILTQHTAPSKGQYLNPLERHPILIELYMATPAHYKGRQSLVQSDQLRQLLLKQINMCSEDIKILH